MEKKSKYDTNPLDPDVARRTEDAWGAETEEQEAATRNIEQARPDGDARARDVTEAPTRRYDEPKFPTSYPSVFVPPAYEPPSTQAQAASVHGNAPAAPQPPPAQPFMPQPTSRILPNINLPENIVLMLPYLPFPYVGAVVAAVLLFLIPRSEPRARFHAAQGLALHAIVVVVSLLTGIVEDLLSGPAALTLKIASAAFGVLAFIFFIVSMIRVYKGEPHVVTPVAELTRWVNEKVEPRKN